MTELTVREAELHDVDAIVALLAQLHPNYPGDSDRGRAILAQILTMPGRILLVATDAEQVVGTADLIIVPNLSHGARPWAILENLVVDSSRRGEGIGKALVGDVRRRAESAGCYMVQLFSLRHRVDAHAFYRSRGYADVACGFRIYLHGVKATTAEDAPMP